MQEPTTDVHVELRLNQRTTFPILGEDVTLHPGKNTLNSKYWRAIKGGLGRHYVEKKKLVEIHPPVDDVEASEYHKVKARRGITTSQASARHRRTFELDATTELAKMSANMKAMQAQMETLMLRNSELERRLGAPKPAPESAEVTTDELSPTEVNLPLDPSKSRVEDITELVGAMSREELEALLAAEKAGKDRSTAKKAIEDALAELIED